MIEVTKSKIVNLLGKSQTDSRLTAYVDTLVTTVRFVMIDRTADVLSDDCDFDITANKMIKVRDQYFQSYGVSMTEDIKVGDHFVNGNIKASNHKIGICENQEEADNLNKIRDLMNQPNFPKQVITAKIILFPRNMSPVDFYRMWIDGQANDNDQMYVQCEKICIQTGISCGYPCIGDCQKVGRVTIKLNPVTSYATLHPIPPKKNQTFSLDQVKKIAEDYASYIYDNDYLINKEVTDEWFDQHCPS
jgi:hypothetical protein